MTDAKDAREGDDARVGQCPACGDNAGPEYDDLSPNHFKLFSARERTALVCIAAFESVACFKIWIHGGPFYNLILSMVTLAVAIYFLVVTETVFTDIVNGGVP